MSRSNVASSVVVGLGTYDTLIFIQHLVVLAQTDQEYQSGDILETVDPLLTFRPLTTNIEQLVCEFADLESRLGDTCRLDTGPEDVLVGGHVTGG